MQVMIHNVSGSCPIGRCENHLSARKKLKPHSSLRFVDRNPHRSYFQQKRTRVDRRFMHMLKNFDTQFLFLSVTYATPASPTEEISSCK